MKKFADLGHVYRGCPCEEYPGQWLLYIESGNPDIGPEERSFQTLEDAMRATGQLSPNRSVSICWQASDNDPRIGQVWFTGFYRHCRYDGATWRWS